MIRKIFGFILLLGFAISSYATHNLAGEITYRHISGLTYEFTITVYADGNSPAIDRRKIDVNWGDNTKLDSINLNNQTQITSNPFPILKRVWKATHTFPGPAFTYRISVEDPNRNANVLNMSNSINVPFTIQSELTIPAFTGDENNSVQLRNDPIDRACAGIKFIYNPGAFDPDGQDSLSYSLAPSKAARDVIAPNFSFPQASNSFSINAVTGDLTWDTPVQTGIYNVAIVITEFRRGFKVGSVLRDIQIIVEGNCNNTAPAIFASDLICVEAGTRLITQIRSSDSDAPDRITLTATGELLEAPLNQRTNFILQNASNPVNTSFEWNTICDDVRKNNYSLNLRAEDNADTRGSVNLVNFKSLNIRVISPGPKNATVQASGKSISLNWDNLDCPNANGYYIYRRKDSSGFVSSNCIPGVPDGIQYERIATISDVSLRLYNDDNNGEGLVPGQKYCYLITKYYPDGDESYASNEVCAEIEKTIPVITNVSITSTSSTRGEIFLAWSPPEKFDATAFPSPYIYHIFDEDNSTQPVDSTNSINDTILSLNNTETESQNRRFKISLLSLGNGRQEVGKTSTASSLFLSTSVSDKQITLTWTDDTPWKNTRYYIFRSLSGVSQFDSIGSVSEPNYTDINLINGDEYCYYIRSAGEYNLNSVVQPIINLSQETCATPEDNISPCSPNFSLESECEDGFLQLTWNDIQSNCAPDLASYRVYFAENRRTPKKLIFETNDLNNTTYLAHEDSVGGCYTVTAVDSAGNESNETELLCATYCPVYELPNVFTPNGDGKNDFFVPIQPYKNVDSIQIQIYNRWGEIVFSTNNIDIKWNGEHQNIRGGKARQLLNIDQTNVNSAVYFYVCEVFELSLDPQKPRIIKGTITVLDSKVLQEKQ
ncbi:gliding motility-associated C-terminal domain-containing protein [Vicingaceae bacterium]|nr:gliding motility-associated C-terminal domain-containing protein [Vicingaceae bacterium]